MSGRTIELEGNGSQCLTENPLEGQELYGQVQAMCNKIII